MSDLLIGVIIGGLLGIVPTICTAAIEVWKFKKQQEHDLKIRYIDNYQVKKQAVLLEYAKCLGALSSSHSFDDASIEKYYSSAESALCLVGSELRSSILSANHLAYCISHNTSGQSHKAALDLAQEEISGLIHEELSQIELQYKPASKRNQKN